MFLRGLWGLDNVRVKFMFSKKATKIEEIFTVDLTLCSKCQIDGEYFVKFCGLLRKHELYRLWKGRRPKRGTVKSIGYKNYWCCDF